MGGYMKYQYKEILLNYEIIGSGIPVLLIHGLGCDMNLMKGCMEPIFQKQEGYQRIYVDLIGMGESSAHDDFASSDKMLEVLYNFIEQHIASPFYLVGESYGGYLSCGLLAHFQNRITKLLLICPVIVADHTKRKLTTKSFEIFDSTFLNTLPEKEREVFTRYMVVANNKTYKYYIDEVMSGQKKKQQDYIDKLLDHYEFSAISKQNLYDCDTKVVVLCGKQDDIVGYEDQYEFCNHMKNSSYHLLQEAGHNLQIDQRKLFHQIALTWLNDTK